MSSLVAPAQPPAAPKPLSAEAAAVDIADQAARVADANLSAGLITWAVASRDVLAWYVWSNSAEAARLTSDVELMGIEGLLKKK